jgi:hypothetical protein
VHVMCDSASSLLLSPAYLYLQTSHGLFALRSPSAFSLAQVTPHCDWWVASMIRLGLALALALALVLLSW